MKVSYFPSQNEWLAALAKASPDLKELVGGIKEARRSIQLHEEFKKSPFQRDSKGSMRFIVPSTEKGINLLEVFDGNLDDVKAQVRQEIAQTPWLNFFQANDSSVELPVLASDKTFLSPEYYGPTLFIYPDSNIEVNIPARRFLKDIAQGRGIEYDLLTIVNYEILPGGIGRRFKNLIPFDLARGQQTLEKRVFSTDPSQKDSLNMFFDITADYFDRQVGEIFQSSEQNQNTKPEDIARQLAHKNSKKSAYEKFARKLIEKYREGNFHNYLADKILATTSFGFNLINPRDRSIVVSNDRDLILMFDNIYDEILPRYMANMAIKTLEQKGEKRYCGSQEALYQAARDQISWAKNLAPKDNTALGILYVPIEDRFYVKEASSALRNFFNGLIDYRHGKSTLITQMALSGESPEKVIERLMNNPEYSSV